MTDSNNLDKFKINKLPRFSYQFDAGPVEESQIHEPKQTGNCRYALQIFFKNTFDQFFTEAELLCPESYLNTGDFVTDNFNNNEWLDLIKAGDVIFAERIKNKDGSLVDRSINYFKGNTDQYIVYLHTAIIYSLNPLEIWHATQIENGTCFWSLEKFLNFYKIARIRRFARGKIPNR